MARTKNEKKRLLTAALLAVVTALALAGCATTGMHLDGQPIDPAGLAADARNQQWNAYRFSTVGPYPYQRVAYVLFGDNVTVDMWSVPYADLGKMSLGRIENDHEAYLKTTMWPGTMLTYKEYRREGKVIAYTANELEMDVDLWEISVSGSTVNLRLIYIDRRSFSGGGGGPEQNPSTR